MDILSQKTMPWANQFLGTSKYYIHAFGSSLTALAECMGITPTEANEKLNSVDGFLVDKDGQKCLIDWNKIVTAFPEWSAQYLTPYNNQTVLDALSKGQFVIVLTDGGNVDYPDIVKAVRYIGGGECHDPEDGKVHPTSDFPNVKGFVVLTRLVTAPKMPEANVTPSGVNGAEPNKPTEEEKSKVAEQSVQTVTLVNLPQHEKEAIVKQVENVLVEVKKLLGL